MNNIEKAVVKKLESIFDNTQHIRNVKVEIEGGISKHTTMRYDVEEFVFEDEWKEEDDEEVKTEGERMSGMLFKVIE